MAVAHEALAQTNWQGADLAEVLARILNPYRGEVLRQVSMRGEPVMLSPDLAPVVCMVLHELATNAVKYGALSATEGRVSIEWRVTQGRLRLEWREQGGPSVHEPITRGFGAELIERATRHQLRGEATLRFTPMGVRCTIDVPFEEAVPGMPPPSAPA
jgi:two-component sensor histidine kinase